MWQRRVQTRLGWNLLWGPPRPGRPASCLAAALPLEGPGTRWREGCWLHMPVSVPVLVCVVTVLIKLTPG